METHPLLFLKNLNRSRQIVSVLLKYGFGDLVEQVGLGRFIRLGRRMLDWRKKKNSIPPALTRAERIRMVLEELGPSFVKFGQVVSTRPDLVPPDVIEELTKLQESLPMFPTSEAQSLIQKELGGSVDEMFEYFPDEPLAAGSLGQVYQARTKTGIDVAVKVRRPNVVQEVESDIALMGQLAILIEKHIPEARMFDPCGLVSHFARTIRREMNFQREAKTMMEFSRLFRNDASLYVPEVYPDLCTECLLTMEFIQGSTLRDFIHREPGKQSTSAPANSVTPDCNSATDDPMGENGPGFVTNEQVADNGAHIYMKMAFELGVFHGDPHPGNLRILDDGTICLLDYGMVGYLDEELRDRLADLFHAVSKKDYNSVVILIQEVGECRGEIDKNLLKIDVRDLVDSYYGVPLEKLNVGPMLNDFVLLMSTHNLNCPSNLMLLIRAFVTLEGMGRWLNPEFNMAGALAPFVSDIIKERYNPVRVGRMLMGESRRLLTLAHKTPYHVTTILRKLSEDELRIKLDHGEVNHLIQEVDRSSNRLAIGMVMSSLILASALLIRGGGELAWVSGIVFIMSSLLGLWLIYGVLRSGSL
ncbi:ABC1 kinase family protein [Polystyrenella longa]|uniref:ABC1 kinase family protein n=1 Tax=Polystyrenella longa TaxID=2528007 RepID=UPI0011A71419|nr:AarF/UbiB family protein [Polystyrenella longa]